VFLGVAKIFLPAAATVEYTPASMFVLPNYAIMEKTPVSFYTVRFNDCDPLGHLNNGRYIDYFLNAREDHLRDHYAIDLRDWLAKGMVFVVSHHEIRYLRPVTYNERIAIQTGLIGWGDSWLLVEMLMFDESKQQMKAILWTRFTRVDPRSGKRVAHPEEFMKWIHGTLIEGVDLAGGTSGRLEELRSINPPASL
jgi:YbgC/YbaW family acyl-CoA thioester hydrolase